ncbi:type IV pilin N-terminal domain-containing protein [uncultured Methanospirillum sp.]|uniref:type IV pilin N-terminal domain-containing protein n=1 Tax=uncultured Methanospirillum sp. TaxID=262503 RepID=UPI0029C7365D|nr:type IV pilin N-terminal domain-containing protein [uncultured Methanospirillum sp.]
MREVRVNSKESAVSPVVGVLLMLVVTIIIAAVVSSFAGGLTGGTTKAPTASLEVHVKAAELQGGTSSGDYVPAFTIKHMGGDVLPTKNLKVTTFFKNQSTSELTQGTLEGEVAVPGRSDWTIGGYIDTKYCAPLFLNDLNRFGYATSSNQYAPGWFGNESAIFRPGDILTTSAMYSEYVTNPSVSTPQVNLGLNNLTGLNCSDLNTGFVATKTIKVQVVDKPSGKTIFDKEVTIE